MSSQAANWLGLAGCAALIAGTLAMARLGKSEIVPITFAEDAASLRAVLTPEARANALRIMAGDNDFPMAYLSFVLAALAFVLFAGPRAAGMASVALAAGAAAAIFTAVAFDYRENAGVVAAIREAAAGGSNLGALIEPMRASAMCKWGFLGLSMALLGVAQWAMTGAASVAGLIRALAAIGGGIAGLVLFGVRVPMLATIEMASLGVVAITVLVEAALNLIRR